MPASPWLCPAISLHGSLSTLCGSISRWAEGQAGFLSGRNIPEARPSDKLHVQSESSQSQVASWCGQVPVGPLPFATWCHSSLSACRGCVSAFTSLLAIGVGCSINEGQIAFAAPHGTAGLVWARAPLLESDLTGFVELLFKGESVQHCLPLFFPIAV